MNLHFVFGTVAFQIFYKNHFAQLLQTPNNLATKPNHSLFLSHQLFLKNLLHHSKTQTLFLTFCTKQEIVDLSYVLLSCCYNDASFVTDICKLHDGTPQNMQSVLIQVNNKG